MMTGQISQGYPVIAVPFQLPEMPSFELEFVIDTGAGKASYDVLR